MTNSTTRIYCTFAIMAIIAIQVQCNVEKCPAIVMNVCKVAYPDGPLVASCQSGMHIIWMKMSPYGKKTLKLASRVEKEVIDAEESDNIEKNTTRMRCSRGRGCRSSSNRPKKCPKGQIRRRGFCFKPTSSGANPDCKGANAFGLACGAAALALGFVSFGAGLVSGVGCTAAAANIVGACGV